MYVFYDVFGLEASFIINIGNKNVLIMTKDIFFVTISNVPKFQFNRVVIEKLFQKKFEIHLHILQIHT